MIVKIALQHLLVAVLIGASPALAATWHIDSAAQPGGDGSGSAPFDLIADGMSAAASGDTVRLAAGIYSDTVPVTAYGNPRLALLELKDGVTVVGAGREATFLHAIPAAVYTFGITAENVGAGAAVTDLAVTGACFQGVNLRSSSPYMARLDLVNDVTGGSSVACDVRDLSFPEMEDILFDGGHTPLVIEFGAGGTYTGCTVGIGPNEGLICNNATPELVDCVFLGAGRDVLVFAQGAQPVLRGCIIADGVRYAVRVAVYPAGTTIDLSGNTWFSSAPEVVADSIRDASDDPALGATVVFEPFAGGGVSVEDLPFGSLKASYR